MYTRGYKSARACNKNKHSAFHTFVVDDVVYYTIRFPRKRAETKTQALGTTY